MISPLLYRTRPVTNCALMFIFLVFLLPWFSSSNALAAPTPRGTPDDGTSVQSVLDGIVRVTTKVPATAHTSGTLGSERKGSEVVIDPNGLVLTIEYVILEAEQA